MSITPATANSTVGDVDYNFKLLLIGDSGVGKSSLLSRFLGNNFELYNSLTVGFDFHCKTIEIDEKTIQLKIWDTAGLERFRAIRNNLYRGADGIIVVYDSTHYDSFKNVQYWMKEIDIRGEKNVKIFLLGNKCDLVDQKKVNEKAVKEYSENAGISFMEISAKNLFHVETVFRCIVWQIIQGRSEEVTSAKDVTSSFNLGSHSDSKHQSDNFKTCWNAFC